MRDRPLTQTPWWHPHESQIWCPLRAAGNGTKAAIQRGMDRRLSKNGDIVGAAFVMVLASSGCDAVGHACGAVGYNDGARLTLHLPPVVSVVPPETVTACREPTCVSATIPSLAPEGQLATVTFSSADVSGLLGRAAGGVRVLTIDWTVHDIKATDPRNDYRVDVTDTTGAATGALKGGVTYTADMPNGEGCGVRWSAALGD